MPCMVLDPFSGAGTSGVVARRLQRRYIGIEQSERYAELSRRRIYADAPLFNKSKEEGSDVQHDPDGPTLE